MTLFEYFKYYCKQNFPWIAISILYEKLNDSRIFEANIRNEYKKIN